jgi:hypothetical protein
VSEPPGYEVEIRPVARSRRSVVAPVAAAAAITAAAVVAAATLLTPAPRHAQNVTAVATATPAASLLPRHQPASVSCGTMRLYDCRAAIDAAQLAIADTSVAIDGARAWPTLICGDNFDCPPQLLASSDPVGSVTLTLADRAVVWINVFRVAQPNRLNETRQVVEARVVRWFAAPA